jgi:hypothetical protein
MTCQALLEKLEPVSAAFHNASSAAPSCLPGTREALLREIWLWFFSSSADASFALWLCGIAGTGKTAVAHSVCEMLEEHLGAAFFFSRDSVDRRRPSNVIPTLMYQLADFNSAFREYICRAIEDDRAIASRSMQKQAEKLVGDVLNSVDDGQIAPVLIVLDALDECDNGRGREGGDLIPLLFRYLSSSRAPFKILITSRPEATIQKMFDRYTTEARPYILHNIEARVVQADIAHFLRAEFDNIAVTRGIEPPWPREDQMEKLKTRSGCLFIYAATAIKFISMGRFPAQRLEMFLSADPSDLHLPHGALDSVYKSILQTVIEGAGSNQSDRIAALFRRVVGSIVALQRPFSKRALARFLNETLADVGEILEPLYSVLDVGLGNDHPIRPFHLSFPDFLADPRRCSDKRFYIQADETYFYLTAECLKVMNEQLKQNICEIEQPGLLNSEIEDLASRMETKISEELRYACVHWIDHLVTTYYVDEDLMGGLSIFCLHNLLNWIEVLSLLGQLRSAVEGIPEVIAWCEVRILLIPSR